MRRKSLPLAKPNESSSLLTSQRVARSLLTGAVLCQLATVAISWSVWNVRQQPPNVPLLPLPALSFAWPIVLSLLAAACWPRGGVIIHAVVYFLACVWDQYRLQPQVISLIVLMAACAFDEGTWFARWYLAAMWLWSGLHKFLSTEWHGHESWVFLESCGLPADDWHVGFASLVAGSEVALGLLAIFLPRRAAVGCVLLHAGIFLSLSPLMRDFNPSVWPWNLATAAIGPWILLRQTRTAISWPQTAVIAGLFLVPAGYYLDLVNAHLAFVLYSGNMPRALHVTRDGIRRLDGWTGLTVPFPDSPWLFRQTFLQTAAAGDKLHVAEPRWGLPDRYFLKLADGSVRETSSERFYAEERPDGEAPGIGLDSPAALWRLRRQGATVEFAGQPFVQAATLRGPGCTDQSIALLSELPNLRELRLEDAAVTDAGLRQVAQLSRLEIFHVARCGITDQGLSALRQLSNLAWLHLEATDITSGGLSVLDELATLQVLALPGLPLDEQGLKRIGALRQLRRLDLHDALLTSADLSHLHGLTECKWIDLSGTRIDGDGLRHLANLTNLEIIQLVRTRLSDEDLSELRRFTRCEHLDLEGIVVSDVGLRSLARLTSLQRLNVRNTCVTEVGIAELQAALPGCTIER